MAVTVAQKLLSRVDSQVVQKHDAGSIYGGTLIEGNVGLYDAMKLGGLDFQVEKVPLYINNKKFIKIDPDEEQAIIRTDTSQFLGTCRSRYNIVQNLDALRWAERVIGRDGACVTSAGVLHGGKYTWLCIDLGGFDVVPGDEIRKHMLIMNSHNGKTNVIVQMLPQRIGCQNVLDFSFGSKRDTSSIPFKIRHTGSAMLKLDEIQKVLAFAHEQFAEVQEAFGRFKEIRVTPEDSQTIIRNALGVTKSQITKWDKGQVDKQPQWVNQATVMQELIERGPGMDIPGVRGSLWGTFNAINSFYEHIRTIRGAQRNPDVAIESRLMGDSHKKKLRAFKVCNEFAAKNLRN